MKKKIIEIYAEEDEIIDIDIINIANSELSNTIMNLILEQLNNLSYINLEFEEE